MKQYPLKSSDPRKHVLLSLLPNAKKMRLFTHFIQTVKLYSNQIRTWSWSKILHYWASNQLKTFNF